MFTKDQAKKYLDYALSTGGDFAELFFEKTVKSQYQMINGLCEDGNSGVAKGLGIRIYDGLESVYAYTNQLDDENIMTVIKNLIASIDKKKVASAKELMEVKYENKHPILKPVEEVSIDEKIMLMKKASDAALNHSELITKSIIDYSDEHRMITIYNSDGKMISDDQTRTRMSIVAVATKDDKIQDGSSRPGAHMGFEFYDKIDVVEEAKIAAQTAITMIDAKDCPSGEMCVVIDNGFGGVIFHEACGHSLEATSVAKGASVFCDKLGQKIASDVVSAVDDGTIANAWGSNNIDDEGNFTQRNLLIENGILKGYLVDTLNARSMKMEITGSARRQDYTFEPTSRMSNTFILNGKSTFDEIISSTKKGLYAKRLGGGSVSPASGDFNFTCLEAYLIEDGKITVPVKGATLVGNGAEILFNIDMVANNGSTAQGMCGSKSGAIPTDVGQPTIRVSKCTVGGKGGSF